MGNTEPVPDPRSSVPDSAREVGNNSIVGSVREFPDTGVAELLDELLHQLSPTDPRHQTRSGSRAIPEPSYELRSHRSSLILAQTRSSSIGPLYITKQVPRKGRMTIATSDSRSSVQVVLSTAAQQFDVDEDIASVVTSELKTQIYSSYLRKPLDLNRSLPPTPISETPSTTPILASFNR